MSRLIDGPSAEALLLRESLVADLVALVAAIDSRMPHVERAGEGLIVRDAGVLRQRALARLETLRAGGT